MQSATVSKCNEFPFELSLVSDDPWRWRTNSQPVQSGPNSAPVLQLPHPEERVPVCTRNAQEHTVDSFEHHYRGTRMKSALIILNVGTYLPLGPPSLKSSPLQPHPGPVMSSLDLIQAVLAFVAGSDGRLHLCALASALFWQCKASLSPSRREGGMLGTCSIMHCFCMCLDFVVHCE